jgi:hypothetical protein
MNTDSLRLQELEPAMMGLALLYAASLVGTILMLATGLA